MGSDIWSSTSSDEEKWQPTFNKYPTAPIGGNAEDIQILLLGPPGSGKSSLQMRYTLRQFSHVVSGGAHLMGGHRHVPLPDGNEVHLIIHEFPTGSGHQTSSMMSPFGPDDISRQDTLWSSSSACQMEAQRKKLLEQSDAVMLLFNPWSEESFEWANGNVVEDIIDTGRKRKLTTDIVGILDGLVAAIPGIQRSRSARSTKLTQKELPRMPNSPSGAGSGVSSLSGGQYEKKWRENDQFDYQGELKRISIVVEGSALKRAEFMIHERDLPYAPPAQNPTPKPLVVSGPMSLSDRKLPTIREVDSRASLRRGTVTWDDHQGVPARQRRDSALSFRTASSAYSQGSSTVVEATHGSSMRESNPFTLEDLVDAHMYPHSPELPPKRPPERRATLPSLPPLAEDLEIPVLVVASMTDRLKDNGGTLPRMVSALQGQELARKFGPNCAYIEVSAKTNANVDEAYGVLVDQVMSRRASRRRDEKPSNKVEEVVIVDEEDVMDKDENDRSLPARVVRAKVPRQKSRSCMPGWWDRLVGSVFSWGPSNSEVSAITFEDIGVRPDGEEPREDVWGEAVPAKSRNKTSWNAMLRSGADDSRLSMSTASSASTAGEDALEGYSIVRLDQFQKTKGTLASNNPFKPEEISRPPKSLGPPPAAAPDEHEKNPRPGEAILDKLDRKLSKKKSRPESMPLEHEPPKATHAESPDEGGGKEKCNDAITDKVSPKVGLDGGPLSLEENRQPKPPISDGPRPLSVDSSILARGRPARKQKPDRSQVLFLTNYQYTPADMAAPTVTGSRSKSSQSGGGGGDLLDDTSSSIITAATSAAPPRRRQHTSLISEAPPSIPPLRFDAIRLDEGRRFTVMIRLAEQELEQQRARVRKLVRDDAAAAAPATRSASVGPGGGPRGAGAVAAARRARARAAAAAAGAPGRARGVGTNTVGPARPRAAAEEQQKQQQPAAAAPVPAVIPAVPARGRKLVGEGVGERRQGEEKGVVKGKEEEQQQEQAAVVRADAGPRAKALKHRRAVIPQYLSQTQATMTTAATATATKTTAPAPPPRRAATLRAVPPPTPAPRPRTRPSSERRPPGWPVPIWI